MVLNAHHSQPLPPSGMEHAVALHLTPPHHASTSSAAYSSSTSLHRGQLVSHIVTARDDVLNVYEVRRKKAFTGGVEADSVYHVRSHQIFGLITGLGKCRVDVSGVQDAVGDDARETLLISFQDAKLALMQWSDAAADLVTISIHTYERAPQLAEGVPSHFQSLLRIDPESRCAALSLPHDALAILPFYDDTTEELDELLERAAGEQSTITFESSLPYAPSFILSLTSADPIIKNVRDFVFLPSFQRPTIAVLFERDQTWTGRLDERNDTCSLRFITLDLTSTDDASHRVISSKDGLPFDSLYLTACPQSIGGGVMITTASALIHIDQGGRIVGTAVSGWHSLTSRLALPRWKGKSTQEEDRDAQISNGNHVLANGLDNSHATNGAARNSFPEAAKEEKSLAQLNLANSHISFPDPSSPSALLFLADGRVWLIRNTLEGRFLSSISLEAKGTSAQPSLALSIVKSDLLFVGSMVGDAHILRVQPVASKSRDNENGNTAGVDDDMDLDAELYGQSTTSTTSIGGTGSFSGAKLDFDIQLAAVVPQLGPILHACPTVTEDTGTAGGLAQTVLCSGVKEQGGLTLLEPQIVPRAKRQLTLNATNGLWLLRSRDAAGNIMVLASSVEGSEIATVGIDAIVSANIPLKGRTIYACSVSPNTDSTANLILRITEKSIVLLREDGKEVQSMQLRREAKNKGADDTTVDVYTAEFLANVATVLWTDGTLQVFRLRGSKLEQVTLPDEVQSRKFVAAGLIVDRYDTFRKKNVLDPNNLDKAASLSFARGDEDEDEVDFGEELDDKDDFVQRHDRKNLWVTLTSNEACLQIYSWPDMKCVWQSNSLYPAPIRLDYVSSAQEEEEVPSLELSQVQLCHVGDVLHLAVAFQNGLVNVYEANAHAGDDEGTQRAYDVSDDNALALSFIKVLAKQLDVVGAGMLNAPNGDAQVEELSLRPFDGLNGHSGLFIGGVTPCWLIRDVKGPAYLHMSAEQSMDHLSVVPSDSDGIVNGRENVAQSQFIYVQYGIVNIAQMPALNFSLPVAHRKKARTQRTYTKATAHPLTKTIVASSVVDQQFVLFDPEDGHVIEDPSIDPTKATSPRSALELFVDEDGEPVDGYEFQQCEMVSCIELVTLRSVGSMSGLKDYIAVGTIISHGEDRPARGATYIFDVVEIVAPQHDPAARFRLRLLVKDDCKGPITNITDMNGYLVIVLGLKLFVRSLEKDEWLITVAFLDVPFQTTSLQRLKNFLLLTDVHRSVWFIAFQEEPYRLVVISKDYNAAYQSSGSFMIRQADMTIVCTSKEGVLRLYDYAPTIAASQGGQRLLVRSEYAAGGEASCRLVVPGPASGDGGIATSNEILFGLMNGALQLVQPVEEEIFAVLHLLQGQLVRTIPHFAGLNPRAFRVVPNELVSRPLTKGILDGRLLTTFEMLSRPKMEEIAALIPDLVDGADQLLRYIATLRSSWGAV